MLQAVTDLGHLVPGISPAPRPGAGTEQGSELCPQRMDERREFVNKWPKRP